MPEQSLSQVFQPALIAIVAVLAGFYGSVLLAVLAVIAGIAFVGPKVYTHNPSKFMSSGRTPAATESKELILSRKGGSGDAYWCDPSVAFASLANFSYRVGKTVDFAKLLEEKGDCIAPYCVDDETRSIVFVETPEGFDPAEVGPFLFQSQRDNAIAVYTVPFEEYYRVIESLDEELSNTSRLLFVYNTSRCGSTLLSKCMNTLANTRSISEPDILTSLTHIASEAHGSRDEDLGRLAAASTKLLCYLRRRKYPDCDIVCIKLRFQMIYIADIMKRALPEAKSIFLYRNGLDVIDSMCAAFINTGAYKAIRTIRLDYFYVFFVSTLPKNLPKVARLMDDKERFPQSSYMHLGAVSPFVMIWLSAMHFAMAAFKHGDLHAMIRYEEMIQQKSRLVERVLMTVGLLEDKDACETEATEENNSSDAVFSSGDVHTGVTMSSRTVFNETTGKIERRGFAYMTAGEAELVAQVMARHEEIEHSGYIIPGTLV